MIGAVDVAALAAQARLLSEDGDLTEAERAALAVFVEETNQAAAAV